MSKTSSTGTIILPTRSACALWKHELIGQFSDGMWENSRPHDHWMFWYDLDVKFDQTASPHVVTTTPWNCKKTKYNIAAILPIVGDRMLKMGRLGNAESRIVTDYPFRTAAECMPDTLEEYFDLVESPREMSDYAHDALKKVTLELAKAFYTTTYTMKHLKADVASIKAAMKTVHG